jgi:hypothetical protein
MIAVFGRIGPFASYAQKSSVCVVALSNLGSI